MSNPYPSGQCTWGAAQMFPCLQNLSVYGNFGNGGDWYQHAQDIGLQTSTQPVAGWLASFSTNGWPSGTGDVGLIQAINSDGTVTRYGVNWHMDGKWSTDRVSAAIVIGSFQPPCDFTGVQTLSTGNQSSSGSGCHTFQLNFPLGLGNVCFDGVVGLVAVAGGLTMMVVGAVIMILAVSSVDIKQGKQTPKKPEPNPADSSSSDKPSKPAKSAPQNYKPGPSANQPPPPPPVNETQLVTQSKQRAASRNLQYRRTLPSGRRAAVPQGRKPALPPKSGPNFPR